VPELIICPPPGSRPPLSDKARAAADYVIDAHRRGVVSDEDLAASRVVQRRLAELAADAPSPEGTETGNG